MARITSAFFPAIDFLGTLAIGIVIWLGGKAVLDGEITPRVGPDHQQIGPATSLAVPSLLESLADPQPKVRWAAARVLDVHVSRRTVGYCCNSSSRRCLPGLK